MAMAEPGYSTGAKWFHWVTATLLLVALPTGFVIQYISDKDDGVHKMAFYAIHESAGLTILLVAAARLAWRLTHTPPPLPARIPAAMQKAGNIKKGSQEATAKGIKRGNMTPAARAQDRAQRQNYKKRGA